MKASSGISQLEARQFRFFKQVSRSFVVSQSRSCSRGIFIVVLNLYGTRGDTKTWAKIISAHGKKCSRMEVSVAEGRWVGLKRGLSGDLSGHERKTGRLQVWRSNKYSAQYPWVFMHRAWPFRRNHINENSKL